MAEWLESKVLKRWFWREVFGNIRDFDCSGWLSRTPIVVKALFWISVALFGWLCLVWYFSDLIRPFFSPQSVIRSTGVFLQLFGFLTAAYGLEKTIEEFGRTPSTKRIGAWMKEPLSVFDTSREATFHGIIRPPRTSAQVSTEELEKEPSKLERLPLPLRLDILEWKVAVLEEKLLAEIEGVRNHISEEAEHLENKIEGNVEAVEQRARQKRKEFVEAEVGNRARWSEWFGISFFIYGVLLANFPDLFQTAFWVVLLIPFIIGGAPSLLDKLSSSSTQRESGSQ